MLLSETEWKIMGVAWERPEVSAREVLEALVDETGWAYTTVKTLMSRLVEKGALAVEMRGNTSVYRSQVSRSAARKSAVRDLIDRAFGGGLSPLFEHLVQDQKLSARDRARLEELLGQAPEKHLASGKRAKP